MPRVKLHPLPVYPFCTDLLVRTTDLNYGGHLGNDRMLSLVHEARVAFLAAHGLSEHDCGGVSLILADAALVYKAEAFAGDRLRFGVAAGEPGARSFRLFFRVTRQSDGVLVALVENGLVCFDYASRQTRPLPDAVRRLCAGQQAAGRSR
jgi:acyl-CoA thioesterase FadM